jgi:hypothetical protein
MEVRIQRTISVHPAHTRKFISLALDMAEQTMKVMGVESEVFYNLHSPAQTADFRIFTDFDSLASYEKLFLGTLLRDDNYLNMAAAAVDMITDEPLDELFVRLLPDDYFMNLGKTKKPQKFSFEKQSKTNKTRSRYRIEREYCASKGRLREVMQMNFSFMNDFFKASSVVPDFFCTRFSTKRIGSTKLYIDSDEYLHCTPAFIEQDDQINSLFSELLLGQPTNSLFMRVTREDAVFSLASKAKK